jgi:hypothetical protein
VWFAATALGGLVSALAFLGSVRVGAWLNLQGQTTPGVVLFAIPFAVAAVAAIPPGLVLLRRGARGAPGNRLLEWLGASAFGGLLPVGYLIYDNPHLPTRTDVLTWYLPVTLVVAGLVATAQTLSLHAMFPRSRVIWYGPLTVLGWALGWSTYLLTLSSVLTQSAVPGILWYCLPWGIIGGCSGLVVSGFPSNRAAQEEVPLWPGPEPMR